MSRVLFSNGRRAIKEMFESLLIGSGLVLGSARRRDRTRAVLAFHNIWPDDQPVAGERTVHFRHHVFVEMLDALRRHATLVSVEELLWSPRDSQALRIAITFDDAYVGATTLGLDALAARNSPSTIFVAPALLGAPSTWWDDAADSRDGCLPADLRDPWLDGPCAGRSSSIRANTRTMPATSPALRIADEAMLRAAAHRPGVTLGSHTWSHPNVAALSSNSSTKDEAAVELSRPLEWLRAFGCPMLPILAYPYGRWNTSAAKMAADVGYSAAFRADGGALRGESCQLYQLPRINISAAMRAGGVFLRVAGWGAE